MSIGSTLEALIERHKLVRRVVLAWAVLVITLTVLRATEPEVLKSMTTAAGVTVSAIIGMLGTVLAFYFNGRQCEDRRGHADDR